MLTRFDRKANDFTAPSSLDGGEGVEALIAWGVRGLCPPMLIAGSPLGSSKGRAPRLPDWEVLMKSHAPSGASDRVSASRRELLVRAALSAAAWPVLGRGKLARAATGGPPLRLILWPSMNGAESQHFWPNPGNLAAMSVVTEPLRAYQRQLTFIRNVDISGSDNHFAVRSMFSGASIPNYTSPDPTAKSLDQVVADQFAATAPTPLRSLHLGVIPADSLSYYQRQGRSTFFFAPKPVDYEANPVTAFDRIFAAGAAPPPPMGSPAATDFTTDVLDLTDAELGELIDRLRDSGLERSKLEQHREALRTLRPGAPGMAPPLPTVPGNKTPIAAVEMLRPALQGNAAAAYKNQYFSDMFDAQVDILARAVVSGLTRVATLQAGSADGNAIVPVDRGYPHHNTSHGNQGIFSRCQQWYSTKFLRLLQALDVPDPLDSTGKTVLYNSIILWLSECLPVSHSSKGVPAMIAGSGGGLLKAGAYLAPGGTNNKAILQTLVSVCGAPAAPQFGSQTIAELRP
jgi:hypothetical protein